MPEEVSPRLELPYLQPSQAQKHVTHNEALQRLDVVTQLSVVRFGSLTPSALPTAGETHTLGTGALDAWAGQGGRIAIWNGTVWLFVIPQEGWRAWGVEEQELRVWTGGDWLPVPGNMQNLDGVGIGTTSDATNRLAVAAEASLFSHDGGGHQLKINKSAAPETASVLFQSGWTGHAEMGLAGDTKFAIKVSPDGSAWTTAFVFDATSGQVSGAAVQAHSEDAATGNLLAAGTEVLAAGPTSAGPDLDALNGTWIAGYNSKSDGPVALTGSGSDGYGLIIQAQRSTNRRHRIFQTQTGQLFHQHETGAGLQPPRRVFDTGNLLGTVSQSGGAATGAVIERGNNANGEYVRFADGTQMCWSTDLFGTTNVPTGALYRSGDITWTYPAVFSVEPNVHGSCPGEMNTWTNIKPTSTGNTSSAIMRGFAAATGVERRYGAFAIGRWF